MRSILFFLCFSIFTIQASMLTEQVAIEINGARVVPGTYHVSPNQRIIDVISLAGPGGQLPPLNSFNSREIRVTSSEGVVYTYDLLRYIQKGDLSQNPYVMGGESIHIGFAVEYVHLSGDIQGVLLGDVPLKRGETASDLLSLYTLNATADTTLILFERVGEPSLEKTLGDLSGVQLQNLDGITIFPVLERREVHRVRVDGDVLRPGLYSIRPGESTARELLSRSGGATPLGDIDRAWVRRRAKSDGLPREALLSGSASVAREKTQGLNNAIISGDFSIIPLLDGDIPLEDGDEIVVPRREQTVYVSGFVKSPGAYSYSAGRDIDYYIDLAGGLSREAAPKRIHTVEVFGDVYRRVESETIVAGNLIVVPEKDRESDTRFVLEVVRTAFQIVTSAVTIAAFIISTR